MLDGVTFSVGRGALVGILGPNGSGKTTLLKLLSGALTPLGGEIRLEGRPLVAWPRRALARRVAFVPQETHPSFDFTVLDIVLLGRYPHLGTFALEGPEDLAIARAALEATGTAAFEERPFNTLSGGEKQRVAIASALAQNGDLLLLDEPTGSLDLGHQLEVAQLLRTLNRDRQITLVLTTHDLNFAAALCPELILLRDGRILGRGSTDTALTADTVRVLYDVEADVRLHPRTERLVVTPIARVG